MAVLHDHKTTALLSKSTSPRAELWTREKFTARYVTHNFAEAVRLGHKIVVLSRRPGRIREVVEIDIPLAERGGWSPELEDHQKHLWGLLREEARAADQELVNV